MCEDETNIIEQAYVNLQLQFERVVEERESYKERCETLQGTIDRLTVQVNAAKAELNVMKAAAEAREIHRNAMKELERLRNEKGADTRGPGQDSAN